MVRSAPRRRGATPRGRPPRRRSASHRTAPRRRKTSGRSKSSRRAGPSRRQYASRTRQNRPSAAGLAIWPLIAGAGFTLLLGRTIAAHPGWFAVVLIVGGLAAAAVLQYRRLQRRRWLDANARLERVDALTGAEFEELVAALMRHDGYHDVHVVGRGGDRGVDVVARAPDGARVAVQCKRWSRPVGAAAVREFVGALHCSYVGRQGLFVASAAFTEQAMREASDAGITLIDRDGLGDWMARTQRTQPGETPISSAG